MPSATAGLNHMTCKHAKPCKLFHVSCKKTSCSTCHAKKNKLFHISCKNHAKKAVPHVMQKNKLFHMSCKKTSCSTCCKKPCKNHAKCGAYGAPTRRTLTLHGFLAICAICAVWLLQGKPLNIHSPRFLAICAICAIFHKATH